MTNQHPITPPPVLVELLRAKAPHGIRDAGVTRERHLIAAAFAAGADQELEACCKWLTEQTCFHPESDLIKDLRAAMRPKPPSLKEQALHELGDAYDKDKIDDTTYDTIRRALEALPE